MNDEKKSVNNNDKTNNKNKNIILTAYKRIVYDKYIYKLYMSRCCLWKGILNKQANNNN